MNWQDTRVFISGGAGVIGSALVQLLLHKGAQLFVGDLKPRPQHWSHSIQYRQGDLNYIHRQELQAFDPHIFFHLAATFERSVETYDFWSENAQHNVRLSHHLMTCLKDSLQLQRVVFASSYLIYDPQLYFFDSSDGSVHALSEQDAIQPRNLTGVAKLLHEVELRFLEEFCPYRAISARIFRVYGRGSKDVISRWVRAALNHETLDVYGTQARFDYVFADDVAEGLLRLADSDCTGVFNLGRGRSRCVQEVIDILKTHFPALQTQQFKQEFLDHKLEASQADMTAFESQLHWRPEVDLEQGIEQLIEYEKKQSQPIYQNYEVKPFNILVTSLSRKTPLIQSLRHAIARLGQNIEIHGGDSHVNCLAQPFVDHFWQMPFDKNLTLEDVLSYCQTHQIGLIIPTRDSELELWARWHDQLLTHGIHVMVSDLEVLNICQDKFRFYEFLQNKGYRTIQTSLDLDALSLSHYVVKERRGAGSRKLHLNIPYEQAIQLASGLQEPIFQPYILGQELSVDVFITDKGLVKGVVLRSRDAVVNGESQVTTVRHHPQLENLVARCACQLGLRGHVVFQGIIPDDAHADNLVDRFLFLECNPRVGGASMLSWAVGLQSLQWAIQQAQGQDLETVSCQIQREPCQLVRVPQDYFFPLSDRSQINLPGHLTSHVIDFQSPNTVQHDWR